MIISPDFLCFFFFFQPVDLPSFRRRATGAATHAGAGSRQGPRFYLTGNFVSFFFFCAFSLFRRVWLHRFHRGSCFRARFLFVRFARVSSEIVRRENDSRPPATSCAAADNGDDYNNNKRAAEIKRGRDPARGRTDL